LEGVTPAVTHGAKEEKTMDKENTTDAKGEPAVASTALLAGDRVTWTHTTTNGRSYNFRVREGRVVEQVGDLVTVKYRGVLSKMRRGRVRRVGERNELTEFVCGKANT
jgi:hypothetical protein